MKPENLAKPAVQKKPLHSLGCTLPIADIPRYGAAVRALGLRPEFYFTSIDASKPSAELMAEAQSIRDDLKGCTAHAPFRDIRPGDESKATRDFALNALLATADQVALVHAEQIVVHTGFHPHCDEINSYQTLAEPILDKAIARFIEVGVRPLLENCHEPSPKELLSLLDTLDPRTGLTLDGSHAALVSKIPIIEWVEAFGTRLMELHLNNNHGSDDEHLAIDKGGAWDPKAIIEELLKRKLQFIPVLEPKDEIQAQGSVAALRRWGLW